MISFIFAMLPLLGIVLFLAVFWVLFRIVNSPVGSLTAGQGAHLGMSGIDFAIVDERALFDTSEELVNPASGSLMAGDVDIDGNLYGVDFERGL